MKKNISILIFFLLTCKISAQESCPQYEEIAEYIHRHLSEFGELRQSSNGFVFIKIDDDYVHKCVEKIRLEGYEEPPYFGQLYDNGAHISVIYPEELTNRDSLVISELGSTVPFRIKGHEVWETPNLEGIERVWVILVEAPYLGYLREKYGFSQENNFHITIGVKPKLAKSA